MVNMMNTGTLEVVTSCGRRCRFCDRWMDSGSLVIRKVAKSDPAFVAYRHRECAKKSGWL